MNLQMFDTRLRQIRNELILLGLLLVLLCATLYHRTSLYSKIDTRHFYLTDSFNTPVVRIWDTGIAKREAVAVLVHGFQCNKSMMVQLGKFLAAQGLDVYAIDLPGHGESSVSFTFERCYEATRLALSEIIRLSGTEEKHVILIGHSFGAMVLGPVALERPNIAASIYIGPGEVKNLKLDTPRNVMIITAEHDKDFIKKCAQIEFNELTGQHESRPGKNLHGDLTLGTARSWQEIPKTDHVGLINNDATYRLIRRWTEQALQTIIEPRPFSDKPSKQIFISVLMLALCAVLASLTSKILPASTVEDRPLFANRLRPFVVFLYAIVCGVALMRFVTPLGFLHLKEGELGFLHLKEGEVLASLLFSVGLLSLVFDMILERKIMIPGLRANLWDALVAITVFFFLYSCLVISVDREFYSLKFSFFHTGRILAFAVIAICLFPLFLMAERLLRYVQGSFRRLFYGMTASLMVAAALYAAFILGCVMVNPGFSRFTETFLAVIGYCALIGAVFYRNRSSIVSGAMFTSFVVAWVVAVSFIYY